MLHVFFDPPYRDFWLSYAKNPKRMDSRHNHWLVRRSAAKAFAEGRLRLNRLVPSMVEVSLNASADNILALQLTVVLV
jgi:hypothetical protein